MAKIEIKEDRLRPLRRVAPKVLESDTARVKWAVDAVIRSKTRKPKANK